MKKNKTLILLFAISILSGACSEYSKAPVVDLQQMRQNAKVDIQQGPDKPRTVTKEVLVEKPVLVVKEESTIDDKFIIITPDPQMTFNEGDKAQYKIRARVLVPGVEVKLNAQGLPEGAKLEKSATEKDLYILTWSPALYLVPSNAMMRTYSAKLSAEVVATTNPSNLSKFKGLVREKELYLFLFRNQENPSDLKIEGLKSELEEGTQNLFSVTVKVPGTDANVEHKPRLVVSYDGISYTAGNSFLELDGSRYVVADENRKDPEYLGDSNWKFSLLFDTKNIAVQPQLGKDGKVLQNADGTRVRLNFKAYNSYGLSTPQTLVQIKIRHTKAATAPANEEKINEKQ